MDICELLERLRFLAEVITKFQKYTFLDNLRTITQKGNMKTRQMTPLFLSTFSDLTVGNIPFWIWKYSKFSFMWLAPFGLFWSVKYLNFWLKLPTQAGHHTFAESRHPEVTKNVYFVLSTRRSQIPIFLGSRSWTTFMFFQAKKFL